jgi:hypothetical protein
LPVQGASTVERRGVRLRVIKSGGATIVTWLRSGHTCILAARGESAGALIALATR